jgi:hypothetical protein
VGGNELFTYAAGITTLFVIVLVMQNALGVSQILTALGNLYGSAVGSPQLPLPTKLP